MGFHQGNFKPSDLAIFFLSTKTHREILRNQTWPLFFCQRKPTAKLFADSENILETQMEKTVSSSVPLRVPLGRIHKFFLTKLPMSSSSLPSSLFRKKMMIMKLREIIWTFSFCAKIICQQCYGPVGVLSLPTNFDQARANCSASLTAGRRRWTWQWTTTSTTTSSRSRRA